MAVALFANSPRLDPKCLFSTHLPFSDVVEVNSTHLFKNSTLALSEYVIDGGQG
jgi:hypothetical protein